MTAAGKAMYGKVGLCSKSGDSMRGIDSIAIISRRLAEYQYVGKLSGLLYRLFSRQPKTGAGAWKVISDYDGNLKIKINRSAYIGGIIYWYGMHSRRVLRYLDTILRRDMVFADIGANQGEFTLFAAKRLSAGKVLAFEPKLETYLQLENNIRLNAFNNVEPFNVALFDREGQADIYSEASPAGSRVHNEGLTSLYPNHMRSQMPENVKLRTLDNVFADGGFGRLDVMKVDVEGAELMVLRGSSATLQRFKPTVILEISPEFFSVAGYDVRTIAQFLGGLGYGFHLLDPHSRLVDTRMELLTAQCDVVCVPLDGSRSMP